MIGRIAGRIEEVGDHHVMIDVNGVGYIAQCSGRTLGKMGAIGESAALMIETQVREDAITLIGFYDAEEKNAFRLLTTVQGVGARVALSILSSLSPEQLSGALASGDKTVLASADGVGPKLAARLATELKDKAAQFGAGNVASFATHAALKTAILPNNLAGDAVSTLTNLGFRRDEAFAAVMGVLGADPGTGFDDLVRKALQDLSPKRKSGAQ
jgi:Holliday junction DNA helicase RuvA